MSRHLIAMGLLVSTFIFGSELIAQQTVATTPLDVKQKNPDEPWMYAVDMPASPTIKQMNSLIQKTGYVETRGARIFTSTTTVVPKEVASFEGIVKWYAEKLGERRLSYFLDRFVETGISGPGLGMFETEQLASATHLTYRFTSEQKQVTILHAEENGDVVTISLLGLEPETSIQVLRHYPNVAAPAQNGGQ
jgi:hypothetical protein